MMMTPIAQEIETCWHRGLGIADTRKAIQRNFGEHVPADQIHAAFVRLSDQFAPTFLHQPERTAA